MKRDIFQSLKAWKEKTDRKPLVLMGARQVGKTYILQQFATEEFDTFVYVNFENEPRLKSLFSQSLDPKHLIRGLEIEYQVVVQPYKTLIIFDEIQECPEALNSLKYFNEQAKQYMVCAAGSLLGVKLKNIKGFPVGQVDFLYLYPLSFSEFINALHEETLKQYLETICSIEPLLANAHDKLMSHFLLYLYIGGMPEAVSIYQKNHNFLEVREVQTSILNAYQLDFSKHAPPGQIMKINQIWKSIPSQLAKENHKFIYSVIRQGARAKEFETAIQWLVEAGLVSKVTHVSKPGIPLMAYENFETFKLYFLDVGLVGAMSDLSASTILHGNKLFTEFKGILIETFVAQALQAQFKKTYYWNSSGKAEADFIIQHEDQVLPLEIKSGLTDKKKSLKVYDEKYTPKQLLRVSPKNLKLDGKILNCPLYLLYQLKQILKF
ncbi:MAG: ATP-binding protein [Gammaproteobacteria bacterium]